MCTLIDFRAPWGTSQGPADAQKGEPVMLRVTMLFMLLFTASAANAASNPYALGGTLSIKRLNVFGDSYSSVNTRLPYWKWSTQFYYDTHQAKSLADVAVGGATGGNYGSSTNDYFGAQVSRFLSNHQPAGGDLTVVYFGYNDMTRSVLLTNPPQLSKLLNDYRAALNRLVGAGYASGDRHILLVRPHDWGHTPHFVAIGGTTRSRVTANMKTWNATLANMAASRQNVVAIDLFTAAECIFHQPGAFGFVDVDHSRPSHSVNPDSYLYGYDPDHFAGHGQRLIRQVITYYLTKGWDWSNTDKDPAIAKGHLLAALEAGQVFAGIRCN
jgi:phospholipase/lecithinase/hemolysin